MSYSECFSLKVPRIYFLILNLDYFLCEIGYCRTLMYINVPAGAKLKPMRYKCTMHDYREHRKIAFRAKILELLRSVTLLGPVYIEWGTPV